MLREECLDLPGIGDAKTRDRRPPSTTPWNPDGEIGQRFDAMGFQRPRGTGWQPLSDAIGHERCRRRQKTQGFDGLQHYAGALQPLGRRVFQQHSQIVTMASAREAGQLPANRAQHGTIRLPFCLVMPKVLGDGCTRIQAGVQARSAACEDCPGNPLGD